MITQENQGPAAARNAGIRAASGEYILPLDADDWIDPTYIEKATRLLETNDKLGIVYCKALQFGHRTGPWNLPDYDIKRMVVDNIIFCCALYRKSDWERVGGYTEALKQGVEDYDFWIKLIAKGIEVYQIDEFLFHYRTQECSRTTRFQDSQALVVATYADIFRRHVDFFAAHAETLVEHRIRTGRELEALRRPFAMIEKMLSSFPRLRIFLANFYIKHWTR